MVGLCRFAPFLGGYFSWVCSDPVSPIRQVTSRDAKQPTTLLAPSLAVIPLYSALTHRKRPQRHLPQKAPENALGMR